MIRTLDNFGTRFYESAEHREALPNQFLSTLTSGYCRTFPCKKTAVPTSRRNVGLAAGFSEYFAYLRLSCTTISSDKKECTFNKESNISSFYIQNKCFSFHSQERRHYVLARSVSGESIEASSCAAVS